METLPMLSHLRAQRSCALFLLVLIATFVLPAQADKRPADKSQTSDKKKEEKLPLKPARKVEFTTDEGTWLSLDVSPDGKSIIFDLLGDLYTIPFAGGEAKKITTGMGFNDQPRYSPDGNLITLRQRSRRRRKCVDLRCPTAPTPSSSARTSKSNSPRPPGLQTGSYVIAARETSVPHQHVRTLDVPRQRRRGRSGHQVASQARREPS